MNGLDEEERRNDDYDDYYGIQRGHKSELMHYPPPPHHYGYPHSHHHPHSHSHPHPYPHPPPPIFGFGPRQDQQLRRTLGDIVKTVLDKMSGINDRMSRNNGNITNDIQELNALMEFLQNVRKFKSQMRY